MQHATPASPAMPAAPSAMPAAKLFNRELLERVADGLAVALAMSLPWSTSATGILSALWLVAVLPTLDLARLREVVLSPAGGVPIAFALLALVGVLWSEASLGDRFASVVPFARLLAIPLLFCQFSRSPRGVYVIYGLLASCTALLITSYWYYAAVSYAANPSDWYPFRIKKDFAGIPVKDYIVQSGLFTICAFTLLEKAIDLWLRQWRRLAIALVLLAMAFLLNMVLVATGRTALLVISVLLLLYALRRQRWRTRLVVLVVGALFIGLSWMSSDYLRYRVTGVFSEIHEYQTENKVTSSGERLQMWRDAMNLIVRAPVLGYGTGSLAATFKAATLSAGSVIPNADNPHNQTFTVAIQLGLLGVALLYAMWLSHLLLFRGSGWEAWFGLVVVVHSVVGSLVNSYLFDFTPGWTYAVCVGVAGGIVLRQNAKAAAATPRT